MSNQLSTVHPGSLHSFLTDKPLDFSGKRFNKTSFGRKHLLEYIDELLEERNDLLTYTYIKDGTVVDLLLVKKDGKIQRARFSLIPLYNTPFGKYLVITLSQFYRHECTDISYKAIKDFLWV